MSSLGEELATAPIITFIVWVGLRIMDLIAQSPVVQTFTPQQRASLGWLLWVNQTSLLTVDIADWLLVLTGVGIAMIVGRWAYQSATRHDVFDV